MKKQFAILVLILLCSSSAMARVHRYDLRTFYSGEAKPSAEVVRIWLDYGIYITDFDGAPVAQTPKPYNEMSASERRCVVTSNLHAAEMLPGKHEIWVAYSDGALGVHSTYKLPLKIDAKAGEDYRVQANFKAHFRGGDNWNPTIAPFTPHDEHFQIRTECRY
jgi:hypothetical protein